MARPVEINCKQDLTAAEIFNSKPEKIPQEIDGIENQENVRLQNVEGLYRTDDSEYGCKYGYVDAPGLKKGSVKLAENSSTKITPVERHDIIVGQTFGDSIISQYDSTNVKIGFYADFNMDGRKDWLRYQFDSENLVRRCHMYIDSPVAKGEHLDSKKYSKYISLSSYMPQKTVDPTENIRIFDIDLDGDLDIVVSFKNEATGEVEHFLFRNTICTDS